MTFTVEEQQNGEKKGEAVLSCIELSALAALMAAILLRHGTQKPSKLCKHKAYLSRLLGMLFEIVTIVIIHSYIPHS